MDYNIYKIFYGGINPSIHPLVYQSDILLSKDQNLSLVGVMTDLEAP